MASSRQVPGFSNHCGPLVGPLLGAAIVAVLDQAVKLAMLTVRPQVSVIPGLFALRFGTNTGGAFGLFQGFPLAMTVLGSLILMGVLVYLVRVAYVATRLERVGLSLLLGGAIGNLVDRVRLGYVVDYFDLFVGQYHWPTFNLADSAITLGVAFLALVSVRRPAAVPGQAPAPPPPSSEVSKP